MNKRRHNSGQEQWVSGKETTFLKETNLRQSQTDELPAHDNKLDDYEFAWQAGSHHKVLGVAMMVPYGPFLPLPLSVDIECNASA